MRAAFPQRFVRQYAALPENHKARFDKQLGFLLANLRHPSLRAKKYDEARHVWQARVDDDYRFYSQCPAVPDRPRVTPILFAGPTGSYAGAVLAEEMRRTTALRTLP